MSASLRNQQGFSLPEVMLAMVLMVMIVTALSGFQRTLMNSLASRNQYQQALAAWLAANATARDFATC